MKIAVMSMPAEEGWYLVRSRKPEYRTFPPWEVRYLVPSIDDWSRTDMIHQMIGPLDRNPDL